MDIEQNLKNRFSAPLKDNYKRRIIFWQDPDREFEQQIDTINISGVKILKLTGTNNFEAKLLLSETDTDSNYLVYNPISYTNVSDDWLLDIELYSEEFRADLVSMRMQDLNMPSTIHMRKVMKGYSKFFDNKERVSRLKSFGSEYTNPGKLHIDILAVLTGAQTNNALSIIKAVLSKDLNIDDNEAISNIRRFGNEEIFWSFIHSFTGYIHDEETSLIHLAEHLFVTTLSVTMNEALIKNFDKLISWTHQQNCYDTINEWMHSDEDDDLYELAREVENQLHLERFFDSLEISDLINSECFPCINECILRKYMFEISENILKADDIVKTVEKRRTLKWYKRVRYYFDGLLSAAQMQQFYSSNMGGFHIADYKKMWNEYCSNYCKMDYYYRQFHAAFSKSLKESSTGLEDLYKNVADYVERLYKNWYLAEMGEQWTNLVKDEFTNSPVLSEICNQTNFYKEFVKPIVSSGSRAYVIISDALRYEVGVELTKHLISDTKGNATITSMQSTFPSVTKFGMPALLPHDNMTMTDDVQIICDGEPTDGTINREKILNKYHEGNVAIKYKDFITMKQAERRERVNKAQVVYIYHNSIDAVGDKLVTEDQVFDACDQAIVEIKNLIRIIINDLSGSNILITADHGFLYSYKPLEEKDKADKNYISGNIVELDRRYVIADGDCTAEHMIKIPMNYVNSKLNGFAPLDNIRIKKQGGGMNYVHGGISLQEMVVPVVEFKNMRVTSKNYIDVKKAEIQLISQSRKISNSIFSLDFYQPEPVSGKMVSATYEVYMSDALGKRISDRKTIIADKTSGNGADRVFRTRFTLKGMEFKKTETYYLNIVERESGNNIDSVEFKIDIAFVNDFDF